MKDECLHPVQIERLRAMTLSERFDGGIRFLRATRRILEAGIRTRHPDWTEDELAAEMRRAIHNARD